MSKLAVAGLTLVVLVAFATNSVLGRAALKSGTGGTLIDPATYTTVRVLFGAVALALIQYVRTHRSGSAVARQPGTEIRNPLSWLPAIMLTLYAVTFSFAYVGLDAASGTLILFGFVQLTMVTVGRIKGERPRTIEIAGLLVASAGLVGLVAPSFQTFRFARESLMMMLAGIGWGCYSALGKGSRDPIADTARNFLRSVPFVVVVSLLSLSGYALTSIGFWLAAISGAITSGVGYVLWYLVLPQLRSAQAAAVQLSVPILAAIGGMLFAGDAITGRTVVSGAVILGGIALTIEWNKT